MKKLLAILMALAMLLSFAACGGNEEEETTAPEKPTVEDVAGEEETVGGEETEGEAETEVITEVVTDEEGNTEIVTEVVTKETATKTENKTEATKPTSSNNGGSTSSSKLNADQLASLMNSATKAIVSKGSYNYNRNCKFTKSIDLGSDAATKAIDGVIKAVDENSSLDSVVGGFLGIGTKTGTMPKDKNDLKDNYEIKATSLKGSDLKNFKESNGVYSFTLADAANPQKNNTTAFSRFSNDFITQKEVVDSIAEFTSAIKVEKSDVKYNTIKVEVTVKDGKITNIKYSYNFSAVLNLKVAVLPITGSGSATTNAVYSNIKY